VKSTEITSLKGILAFHAVDKEKLIQKTLDTD